MIQPGRSGSQKIEKKRHHAEEGTRPAQARQAQNRKGGGGGGGLGTTECRSRRLCWARERCRWDHGHSIGDSMATNTISPLSTWPCVKLHGDTKGGAAAMVAPSGEGPGFVGK